MEMVLVSFGRVGGSLWGLLVLVFGRGGIWRRRKSGLSFFRPSKPGFLFILIFSESISQYLAIKYL